MKSITTIVKGDESGELVNINAYETNVGRFRYTGQIALPELGFYHCKANVYSPTLGRFLQPDPIGYEDQANLSGQPEKRFSGDNANGDRLPRERSGLPEPLLKV